MRGKTIVWVGLCVALGGSFYLLRRPVPSPLPPMGALTDRPALFRSRLQAARDRAAQNGYRPEDLRSLAHLYEANRLNAEARECYRLMGAGNLGAKDHYYLAEMDQYGDDLEQAAVELRATNRSAPEYLPAHLALADVLLKSGRTEEARVEYEVILGLVANQPQAMFGLARIELQRGRDDEAIARLGALMVSHPEMTSGAALLAQVFDRRGEKARAEAMTKWSRQKPEPVPLDPWLDALLSDCYDIQRLGLKFEEYFTSGEMDQALPLLVRVEELDPNSSIPPLLRGWSKARDHDDRGAVAEYRQALNKGGDPEKICPYMVQSLLALGEIPAAAALMAEFHAKKPASIPLLISYADVVVKQGDTTKAKLLLAQVVEREPYLTAANLSLARILWAQGDKEAAAQCLERVIKVSSTDVASRAVLAQYYLEKLDPGDAISPLVQAVALENGQPELARNLISLLYTAYVQKGVAVEKSGDAASAVSEFFDKAIALQPNLPAAYALKAKACAGLRQFGAAAEALGRLTALQPGNPTVYLSLGDVVYQTGEKGKARANWQTALGLVGDGNPALRAALEARLTGPISEESFQ